MALPLNNCQDREVALPLSWLSGPGGGTPAGLAVEIRSWVRVTVGRIHGYCAAVSAAAAAVSVPAAVREAARELRRSAGRGCIARRV